MIVAIPSSSAQTSRREDPQEVDIQAEGEHLVARPEEAALMSSNPAGEEEVWMTFFRSPSIPKLQMAIVISGVGCQVQANGPWIDDSKIYDYLEHGGAFCLAYFFLERNLRPQ